MGFNERWSTGAGWTVALILGLSATLPAIWWEPLHVDERTTLEFAPRSFETILHDIFVERGGAPLFFFVEHATLVWPDGLEGLRGPSLLFFVLALPMVGLVARELLGRREALAVPALLAVAPLAVGLATFARMYSLFLLFVLGATWLALRAAREQSRRRWAVAGAAVGILPYVHPMAPLYAVLVLATGVLRTGLPLRRAVRTTWPAFVAAAIVALPYAWALRVLRNRYDVGLGEPSVRTRTGRSVPEEVLHTLVPDRTLVTVLIVALAAAGFVALLRRDARLAVAVLLWILTPLAFFTLVPAGDTNFYPRYLIPVLPFWLLLLAVGSIAVGALVRRPVLVGGLLVAACLAWESHGAYERLDRLHALELPRLTHSIGQVPAGILFSSTGSETVRYPPDLLDDLVALEVAGLRRLEELPAINPRFAIDVPELGRQRVLEFLRGPTRPGNGIWIFSGSTQDVERARSRLVTSAELDVERVSPTLLLVRSASPKEPRDLVEQAVAVREAWVTSALSGGGFGQTILEIDRSALAASEP